ncbi:hypothetical protein [Stenotrophomonas pictorum]|nr:hypothetical protein [Stenotrophomonas pictorum]
MGLMPAVHPLRKKVAVMIWRLRHWWLDTPSGEAAQKYVFAFSVLASVIQFVRLAVMALIPAAPAKPIEAIWPLWVINLIVMVVVAAISYAMRPKPETPKPLAGEAPTVEDGQSVKHHFGTVWVEDEFILAWKVTGTVPIKSKGGKK